MAWWYWQFCQKVHQYFLIFIGLIFRTYPMLDIYIVLGGLINCGLIIRCRYFTDLWIAFLFILVTLWILFLMLGINDLQPEKLPGFIIFAISATGISKLPPLVWAVYSISLTLINDDWAQQFFVPYESYISSFSI